MNRKNLCMEKEENVTRRQKSWSTCLESSDLVAIGIVADVEVGGGECLNQRAATAVSPCSECVVQFCLAFQQCHASCVESQHEYVIWLSCLLGWSGTACPIRMRDFSTRTLFESRVMYSGEKNIYSSCEARGSGRGSVVGAKNKKQKACA